MARSPAENRVQQARNLKTVEEARALYRAWAAEYDDDIAGELKFTGGADIAELLTEWLTNKSSRIIDLGCGTGLVGAELQRLGYFELDGLDLSPEMLEVARSKNIYRNLIEADLMQPLDMADATYDGAISAGTFTAGHVHAGRLREIVRIIKPGGWLAFVVASDYWHSGGFAGMFKRWELDPRIVSLRNNVRAISRTDTAKAHFCLAMVGEP